MMSSACGSTGPKKISRPSHYSDTTVAENLGERLRNGKNAGSLEERVTLRIKQLNPNLPDHKAREYAGLFIRHCRDYQLDVNMVVHICCIESRFKEKVVSPGGNYGLMQINWTAHKSQLKMMGISKESILEPDNNIRYACRILRSFTEQSETLYGIVKRYSPVRPDYYTRLLKKLMSESVI